MIEYMRWPMKRFASTRHDYLESSQQAHAPRILNGGAAMFGVEMGPLLKSHEILDRLFEIALWCASSFPLLSGKSDLLKTALASS